MVDALKTKLPMKIRFSNHDILSKKVSWLRHNHDIFVVNHDIFKIFQDIFEMAWVFKIFQDRFEMSWLTTKMSW